MCTFANIYIEKLRKYGYLGGTEILVFTEKH